MDLLNSRLAKIATAVDNINDYFDLVVKNGDDAVLGSGGFGIVRRCVKKGVPGQQSIPSEPVAVKTLKKSTLQNPKKIKHLMVELTVMKHCVHPNMIKLYDVLHTASSIYLVMELCDGVDLMKMLLDRDSKFPPSDAAIVVKQLLNTLQYLHSQHIVHRDIKPENILIDPHDLHIKLIDYGLAKYFGPTNADYPPTPGAATPTCDNGDVVSSTPCGTCNYLAFEAVVGILDGGRPWHTTRQNITKLDTYAVGVIAHVLLCMKLPFQPREKFDDISKQLSETKKLHSAGLRFPASARSVPMEALQFTQLLLNPDVKKRPTAMFALGHKWLQKVVVPLRMSKEAVTTLPAANKDLVFSKPGFKKVVRNSSATDDDNQSDNVGFLGDQTDDGSRVISGNGFEELLLRLRKSEDEEE
eukprot:TRINITY_DN9707_c0_g1_i1.p1 TRINITY_DN9707_c0_g1~~TRINITY_DN9707_c0_g1_i1.p1  ORF type:complete len:413 (+),score=63.20 TRINITY_DN9707_c0_g1_i1:88-1326(+)